METTASKAAVGAFTLAVIAGAFLFIFWLARAGESGEVRQLTIHFDGPVTGLAGGSQVSFNGIRVGSVKTVYNDLENPSRVIARLDVNSDNAPVKPDTRVFLSAVSLTGVSIIDLIGGSPDAESIWKGNQDPVLPAETSGISDLIAGAKTTLERMNKVLATAESLLDENTGKISNTISNVEEFTGALAANSDKIDSLLASITTAADSLAKVSGPLERAVNNADAILAAVDPDDVGKTVQNVESFTASLAQNTQIIDEAVQRVSNAAADVSEFTKSLPPIAADAQALVADLKGKISPLLDAIDPQKVGSTVDSLAAITASIDPEQVRIAVSGIADTAATLSASQAEIKSFLASMSDASTNVAQFSERLPALGDEAGSILAAVDPVKIQETISSIQSITAAINPERIQIAVDGISNLAAALSANQADIENLVQRLSAASTNIAEFASSLPVIGENAEAILLAVDPEKVRETVDGVTNFANTLNDSSENVKVIIAQARDVTEGFNRLTVKAESLLGTIQSTAESDGGKGLITQATETLKSIQQAADSFNKEITSVGSGINNLTSQGLRDFQGLIRQGQRTINRLNRVLQQIERNPGQFVLGGGERVPQYGVGNRR